MDRTRPTRAAAPPPLTLHLGISTYSSRQARANIRRDEKALLTTPDEDEQPLHHTHRAYHSTHSAVIPIPQPVAAHHHNRFTSHSREPDLDLYYRWSPVYPRSSPPLPLTSYSSYTSFHSDFKMQSSSGSSTLKSMPSFESIIASKDDLQLVQKSVTLPPKSSTSFYRSLRWNFFSVYRKIFALVLCLNVAAIAVYLTQVNKPGSIATYENAATAASVNFLAALLMRNEHVVNLLFHVACMSPLWFPLAIRRRLAKVYSYGGMHSACGVSGTLWYIVFAGMTVKQYPTGHALEIGLAVTTAATLLVLVIILIFAHPILRAKLHNHFETTHRFGGWTAVAMLWAQTILLVFIHAAQKKTSFGTALILSPPFWILVIITGLLIYPWLRLRRHSVYAEKLSRHAVRLHFDYTSLDACVAIRLTDAPLMETHGFATIPNYKEDGKGFTVLVSNAGDWTNKLVTNPPKHIYVKGAPTIGVLRVATMFKKVLVVATGSGIGPCLSLLQARPDIPLRILWSAPAPQATFGDTIVHSILRSDPKAMVIDTKKTGRPDLVALAYAIAIEDGCEAVVVISNPAVTRKVVYGLETRGVAAYGPIFDS